MYREESWEGEENGTEKEEIEKQKSSGNLGWQDVENMKGVDMLLWPLNNGIIWTKKEAYVMNGPLLTFTAQLSISDHL